MMFNSLLSSKPERPSKRRIQRRHGACEPCRSSKTKCDGRMPCGACRSERRRQCPCVYSEKVMKLQQVTAEMRRRTEIENPSGTSSMLRSQSRDSHGRIEMNAATHSTSDPLPAETSDASGFENGGITPCDGERFVFRTISLAAAVDEFKGLKQARGSAIPVIGRCDGRSAIDPLSDTCESARSVSQDVHNTHAQKHEDHLVQNIESGAPELRLQLLIRKFEQIRHAVQAGQLTRAWVDIASVVREAEVLQPSICKSGDELRDSWQKLRNDALGVESQLGLAIGRPTCCIQEKKSGMRRSGEDLILDEDFAGDTRMHLYQRIQLMLSLDVHQTSDSGEFLEQAWNILSNTPFNKIGLCTTEAHPASARHLQLSIHVLFMVIYCRLASMCDIHAREGASPIQLGDSSTGIAHSMGLKQPRQKLAYCRKMFRSAKFLLNTFISLAVEDSTLMVDDWLNCYSAYVAAMLLGIAKLRYEVEWESTTELLQKLEDLYRSFAREAPGCQLFSLAVDRLRDLNSIEKPPSHSARNKYNRIKRRECLPLLSVVTSPRLHSSAGMDNFSDNESTTLSLPYSVKGSINDTSEFENAPTTSNSSTSFDDTANQMSFYSDGTAAFSPGTAFVTHQSQSSAATFCPSDVRLAAMTEVTHPGPPFVYPFPCESPHPPIIWALPDGSPHNAVDHSMAAQDRGRMQYFQQSQNLPPVHGSSVQALDSLQSAVSMGTAHDGDTMSMVSGLSRTLTGRLQNSNSMSCSSRRVSLQDVSHPHTHDAFPPGQQRNAGMSPLECQQSVSPASTKAPSQQIAADTWGMRRQGIGANLTDLARQTSAGEIFHARLQHDSEQQAADCFVTGGSHATSVLNRAPPHTFRPVHVSSAQIKSSYFNPSNATQLDQGHIGAQLCQNYGYSFPHAQDYVQEQGQWRRMAIGAGTPGVP